MEINQIIIIQTMYPVFQGMELLIDRL